MFGLLGGMVTASVLFAGYTTLAVRAVRALDRQYQALGPLDTGRQTAAAALAVRATGDEDAVIVAQGRRALSDEHRKRLEPLLRDCRGVLALDPGVRALRTAVCDAIRLDIEALRLDPFVPVTGQGRAYAERLLNRERRQWHVDIADEPAIASAPFAAAHDAEARLFRFTDEPLDDRLLVLSNDSLRVLDLRASSTTEVDGGRVFDAEVLKTWIAYLKDDGVWGAALPALAGLNRFSEPADMLVGSPETDTVWVGKDGVFTELTSSGFEVGHPFAEPDEFLVAATAEYLVSARVEGERSRLSVWDRQSRRLAQRIDDANLLDAQGDMLVWVDGEGRPHTNKPGFTFDMSNGPVRSAAIGLFQGRVVTVAPETGGATYLSLSKPDGSVLTTASRTHGALLRWAPNGLWLFIGSYGDIAYADSDFLRNRALRLPPDNVVLVGVLPRATP